MIGEWSRKISNQICENQNEKEIIQYGLNQLFWILLNFFAIVISGVLWHEFCFSILVFLEIYFLRPYAGGYHADTEIKCCMISVGIVNIAMLVRKIKVISLDCMFVIYLCFICVIVLFSPVDNPIHPLSKVDSRFYAKRSRQLIFWYSFLLVISIALRIMVLRDSIIYTVLIVGISALAGKWKYRKRVYIIWSKFS